MERSVKIMSIISVVLIVILFLNHKPGGSYVSILSQDKENMVSARLYDKNNNLITNNIETFSIINYSGTGYRNVPGVYSIDFIVKLTNLGEEYLNCSIIDALPVTFNNSLPRTNLGLNYFIGGNTVAWTSSRLYTAQFENLNSTIFNVTIKCAFTNKTSTYSLVKSGWIEILITSEKTKLIIFRTNINQSLDIFPFTPAMTYQSTQDDLDKTTDGNLKWISFDKNGDLIMEKYGITTSLTGSNLYCDKWSASYNRQVLLYMPFGQYLCLLANRQYCDVWIVNSSTVNRIGLCYNNDEGHSTVQWWSTTEPEAINAIIVNYTIPPYNVNQQERYKEI